MSTAFKHAEYFREDRQAQTPRGSKNSLEVVPGLSEENIRSLMIDLKSKLPSNVYNNAHILSVIIGRVNGNMQVGPADIIEVMEQKQKSSDKDLNRLFQFD